MTTGERNESAWRSALRATRIHADPALWRTRLAARLHAATRHAGATHLTVVSCQRNRPEACEYGYHPARDTALGDLVFGRIMPRLLGKCRDKWDAGVGRYGPIVPVFEVFGGGPIGGPFRVGCAAAGIESALLAGLWADGGLIGYVMVAGRGDEHELWRRLAPDLERVAGEAEKALAFAARLAGEAERWRASGGLPDEVLSRRERDVATLAAEGFSDMNIAARLGISEATVGTHLHRIYRKLEVHSRVGLSHRLRRSAHDAPDEATASDAHERARAAFDAVVVPDAPDEDDGA